MQVSEAPINRSDISPTQRGFTLIELMIVLVIIGIVTAIAYPSYTGHIAKGRRADARAQLLQATQFMQRFYSANDRYDLNRAGNAVADQMPANLKRSPPEGTQMYELTVNASATSYTLTMAPVSGTAMYGDKCGSYTLSSDGAKGVSGATLSRDECWK